MPGRQRLSKPRCADALCFQFQNDPRSHDVSTGERPAFLRLEDPEVRELSDPFDARPRPIGEFAFGEPVTLHAGRGQVT